MMACARSASTQEEMTSKLQSSLETERHSRINNFKIFNSAWAPARHIAHRVKEHTHMIMDDIIFRIESRHVDNNRQL